MNTNLTAKIQDKSINELFVAMLIAELGTRRFEALRDRFFDELDLPDTSKLEVIDQTIPLFEMLSELHEGTKGEEGGLGEATIKLLGRQDLTHLSEPGEPEAEPLSAYDLLTTVLLRNAKIGEINDTLNFLHEKVSVKAARAAKQVMRDLSTVYIGVDTDELFATYLRERMEDELQGPTGPEERARNARRTDRRGGLMGMLAGILGGGMSVESIFEELSSMRGGEGPSVRVLDLDSLLNRNRKPEPTVGDVWRMQNVPFGLPDLIADFLQHNDPHAQIVNMDAIRATPLRMFLDGGIESMRSASKTVVESGLVSSRNGRMVQELFELTQLVLTRDFGSIEAAQKETARWLSSQQPSTEERYAQPTPGCDCPRCSTIKTLDRIGIKVDRNTGEPVRV